MQLRLLKRKPRPLIKPPNRLAETAVIGADEVALVSRQTRFYDLLADWKLNSFLLIRLSTTRSRLRMNGRFAPEAAVQKINLAKFRLAGRSQRTLETSDPAETERRSVQPCLAGFL